MVFWICRGYKLRPGVVTHHNYLTRGEAEEGLVKLQAKNPKTKYWIEEVK